MKAVQMEPEKNKTDLIALATEAMEIARIIVENGGELTPELEARFDINAQDLMNKVDSYVAIEEQFDAQAAHWKAKADACNKIARQFSSCIERMRDRVKFTMKQLGKTEIMGRETGYKLGKSAPKLIIADEQILPAQFKMVVQSTMVDKELLKDALKSGFEVPGAYLEESGSLRSVNNTKKR